MLYSGWRKKDNTISLTLYSRKGLKLQWCVSWTEEDKTDCYIDPWLHLLLTTARCVIFTAPLQASSASRSGLLNWRRCLSVWPQRGAPNDCKLTLTRPSLTPIDNKHLRISFHNVIFLCLFMWDVTPSAPPTSIILLTIPLLGRWSTSGSVRGNAHFLPLQEYNRGNRRKKKKRTNTNNLLGVTQVQKGSSITPCACADSIYGLTLAWVTSENSTKLLECRLIFPHCGWTLMSCWLASLLRCPESTALVRVPSPTLCQLLCLTNSLLASRYHFRPHPDFNSKTLCLVSRQNRQKNRLLGGPPT